MVAHDVLDDGKAQTASARVSGSVGIDPVKPFGQTRDVMAVHARTVVGDFDQNIGIPG